MYSDRPDCCHSLDTPTAPHLLASALSGPLPLESQGTGEGCLYKPGTPLEGLQGGTYLGVAHRREEDDDMYLLIPSCLLLSSGQVHGASSQDTSVAFCTMPCGPGRRAEIVCMGTTRTGVGPEDEV